MGLRVIAIDSGEEKEKMTKELGAAAFCDFGKSQNLVKDVQAATEDGTGPHAVLLVAVSEKPFQQAAEVCFFFFFFVYLHCLPLYAGNSLASYYQCTPN